MTNHIYFGIVPTTNTFLYFFMLKNPQR